MSPTRSGSRFPQIGEPGAETSLPFVHAQNRTVSPANGAIASRRDPTCTCHSLVSVSRSVLREGHTVAEWATAGVKQQISDVLVGLRGDPMAATLASPWIESGVSCSLRRALLDIQT